MAKKLVHRNLTDDYIINKLAKGKFVTNENDFNLKNGSKSGDKLDLTPVPGGLYDGKIFGSLYPKRCNCGAEKTPGKYCRSCGSRVLPDAERFTRYGAYSGFVYYTNPIKIEVMKDRLYQIFDEVRIDLGNSGDLFYSGGTRGGINWKTVFNLAQFNVDTSGNGVVLVITDELTDSEKISLEGVKNAVDKYRPAYKEEFAGYMNRVIPILPIALRPVRLNMFDGRKKTEISQISIMYRAIIYLSKQYEIRLRSEDNIYAETLLKATLREFIGNQLFQTSDISKGSRGNFFRTAYTNRVIGSGRGVIAPDTELKITEVGIPFHLAYELYKTEFVAYIENIYGLSDKHEAIELYKSANEVIINLFYEFIAETDKHVLLNRNPTLHRYNTLCMKVILVRDSTIHLPMLLCTLFGGDFDGDEMNFFAIPNELKDYAIEHASPKSIIYYEKDHDFLFKFNHETLNGIIISSKIDLSEEPRHYVSMDDVESDFQDSVIEVDTAITFEDDRITTYGRLKIGNIIGCSVDALLGDGVAFNAKNVSEVYALLAKYDGDTRVDMYQKLQEFVLEMVYLSGETTLPLEDIYNTDNTEFSDKIKDILNDSSLSEDEKLLLVENAHETFIENYMNSMDDRVKTRISESSRMKMTAYLEMTTPQILFNADKSVYVSEHTLVDGLTESELIEHALNNRKLLELKFKAVPTSGYLTRQLATLGQSLVLKPGTDPENEGILLPRNRVEGRTLVTGELVGKSKSEELVRVRSILTSDKNYLTPDMISTFNQITFDVDGVDHKGTSFMMSLTESTTQKGLSLKHGGMLRSVLTENRMYASMDCELKLYDKYFELIYPDGYVGRFPRTKSMVFNKADKFTKGMLICQLGKLHTFSYVLDCVIKLCKAVGRVTLADVKNNINFQRCISTRDGVIRYNFEEGYYTIGTERINIMEDTLYFYPDGEEVTFGTKFCSGIENVQGLMSTLIYIESYQIFRAQFRFLMPHIAEEIIESLFYLITNRNDGVFLGVLQSNTKNTSLIPNIAFGYAKKGLIRAAVGKSEIKQDTYSNSLINPFLVNDMMDAIES